MRPVNRSRNTTKYTDYHQARNVLADSIGWYCSYCEMPIKNMIEVEHVIPINRGGDPLSWHNFLLCCKYCNTVKSNNNPSRSGYFWPDKDNTFRAFEYKYGVPINVNPQLNSNAILKNIANNTIKLMGLNREPNSPNEPTKADTRWISRKEAWEMALISLEDYNIEPNNVRLQDSIVRTAKANGHFSIWMEVFKNIPEMKVKFINTFIGTHTLSFDSNGIPVYRHMGQI